MRALIALCAIGWIGSGLVQAEPLTFIDRWVEGGQPVYGQSRAVLSATRPADLTQEPRYPGAPVRYGAFSLSDPEGKKLSLLAALVGDPAKPAALYVDCNQDGSLTALEALRPATPTERPAGFGEAAETVWMTRILRPYPRLLAFRVSPVGCMLVMAMRGAYQAEVSQGDARRRLLVVDANADLWLRPGGDYAYLDLNGNGQFETQERFQDLALIEAGGPAFRIAPAMPVCSAAWSFLPKGEADVRFVLGQATGTPQTLVVGLTRDQRYPVVIESLDKPSTLPAGSYVIESITAKMPAPDGSLRSYTFARTGGGGFEVTAGTPATVDLLGKITVNVSPSGKPQPGGTISLEVSVTTSTGLQMTACATSDTQARQDGLIPPVAELRSPSGAAVDSGTMEFG